MRNLEKIPTREIRCLRCEQPVEGINFTLAGVVMPFDACRPCRLFRYIGNVEDLDGIDTETLEAVLSDLKSEIEDGR